MTERHVLTILRTSQQDHAYKQVWVCKWSCSCDAGDWLHTTLMQDSAAAARLVARVDHNLHVARMMEMAGETVKIAEPYRSLF